MQRKITIASLLVSGLLTCICLGVPTTVTSARSTDNSLHPSSPKAGQIFVFQTDEFWLNLHHFLYVLGRAQNKTTDAARDAVKRAPEDQDKGLATLKEPDQVIWKEAVAAYASDMSKKDLIFDDPLPAITNSLAKAADAKSLAGLNIDAAATKILEAAAPVYRKVWWPDHYRANQAWRASVEKLVAKHGETILAFITSKYQMKWPETGFGVNISGYSNWAGAYSTKGDLLVLSSLDESNRDLYSLESVFHEGMHQWDSQVFEALREQARKQNKLVPRGLSHALIFFTAGEAVRRVAPEHVPYAERYGVWKRGMNELKGPIEETWKPYLDGRGTREEAFAELIKKTATDSRPSPARPSGRAIYFGLKSSLTVGLLPTAGRHVRERLGTPCYSLL